MRTIVSFLFMMIGATVVFGAPMSTIDAGRGSVPLVVPENYSKSRPVPLVVLLHGYTSSGAVQEAYMEFGKLVNKYGYILATPDGTKETSDNRHRFWNATEACCDMYGSGVDDSAYLRGLIDRIKKAYSIHADRVYLIGHSNGGFMSHRMAVDHPDTIAAIVSLAGAAPIELTGKKPSRRVSILQIHGTGDAIIKFRGGKFTDSEYPGALETVEKWAAFNGSTDSKNMPKKIDLDRGIEGDETIVKKFKKSSVELWTIRDGEHVPALSDQFTEYVIQWLMAHPKGVKY